MSEFSTDNRALKFTVFLLGIAVPIAGMLLWASNRRASQKQHADELQEAAVVDSFPASDPPASW